MVKVKGSTKKGEGLYQAYESMIYDSVYQLYETPSKQKVEICEELQKECKENNGFDFRCGRANCMQYSVGYMTETENEDGLIESVLVYHTKDNVYHVYLNR